MFTWVSSCLAGLLATSVLWVPAQGLLAGEPPRTAPSASPSPGNKSVSSKVHSRELPGQPVGVKALSPGEPPAASSSHLGPGSQSQMGVGLQFRLGGSEDKKPGAKKDETESDGDDTPSDPRTEN